MTKQLTLVSSSGPVRPRAWRLDERTREIGRRGLTEARAALTSARRRSQDADPPTAAPPAVPAAGGSPPGARDRPAA
ncbi:MAG TPA: hypothetical protein VE623_14570 [Acidimicrobiales bacterium]|nr:hypothetical protein [Acidimicrobiales bacterium]